MKEFLASLDWMTLLSAIWTVILVPIGTQIYKYLKTKKLDKYALILYREVKNAVKSVYETEVKDIKGTDAWTEDKMNEVKEIAKQKASIEKELKSEIEKMNNIALYEKMAKEHPENPRLAELVNALKELGE